MLPSIAPHFETKTFISVGPEKGRSMTCTVNEGWRTIIDRTIKCESEFALEVKQRKGISSEDQTKLKGLIEAGFGIPKVAHAKSTVGSEIANVFKFEEFTEVTETYKVPVGKCDERHFHLVQEVKLYEFYYEEKTWYRTKKGQFDVLEYCERIWDRGQITKNHPDCSCGGGPQKYEHFVGMQIGENIFSTDGVTIQDEMWSFGKLGIQTVSLDQGDTFSVPAEHVPSFLSFLAGESLPPEAPCRVLWVGKSIDEDFKMFARRPSENELNIPNFAELEISGTTALKAGA